MLFSLILCTTGNINNISNFFLAMKKQEHKKFEVIVVDQSNGDEILEITKKYKSHFSIKHLRSPRGLSRARNQGLLHVLGEVIAFPDDDCIYPKDMLRKVNIELRERNCDVLSIKMTNSVSHGRKIQEGYDSKWVRKNDVFRHMASISSFYKREVIERIGGFDERLGLGTSTIFCGAEDYDYPIRALCEGYTIYYCNSIEVLHPWDDSKIEFEKKLQDRVYGGGAAEMFVLNKHNYGVCFKSKRVIRRLCIIFYYLLTGRVEKSRLSLGVFKGMLRHFNYKVN